MDPKYPEDCEPGELDDEDAGDGDYPDGDS